jgi:pyruvate/2-oxoglutarate dehydrogenase complex dihydrolipoamide dehydrogenase (E3) component
LEFAQIYRRFGSEVTVIELASRLIAREDEDVSEAVTAILKGEGIGVGTGAECLSETKNGEEIFGMAWLF